MESLLISDLEAIDELLSGKKLGVIGDPWFKENLIADLGDRVLVLEPNRLDSHLDCRAILLHSSWPDLPSPWENELLPSFGEKMLSLLEAANGGRDKLSKRTPIIYWHLEGGNKACWDTFRHFRDAAKVIGTTSRHEVEKIEDEQPGKIVLNSPMAASVNIFYKPRMSWANSRNLIFTGRWYGDHEGRKTCLQTFKAKIEKFNLEDQFKITNWGGTESWPTQYRKYLIPKVESMSALAELYRKSRLGLNHNLWEGGVSMRYPGMIMSGLPVAWYDDLWMLSNQHSSIGSWDVASAVSSNNGLSSYRISSRILQFLIALRRA